jgi:hypothetical protein
VWVGYDTLLSPLESIGVWVLADDYQPAIRARF